MNWIIKIIDREREIAEQQLTLAAGGSLRIGRNSQLCDVALEDKSLSRQHFSVVANQDSFQIHDLNSTLGTWVDSQKIMTGGSEVVNSPGVNIPIRIEAGKRFEFVIMQVTAAPIPVQPIQSPAPVHSYQSPHQPVSNSPATAYQCYGNEPQSDGIDRPMGRPIDISVNETYAPSANHQVAETRIPADDKNSKSTPATNSNYTGKLNIDLGQLKSLDESDFADENW